MTISCGQQALIRKAADISSGGEIWPAQLAEKRDQSAKNRTGVLNDLSDYIKIHRDNDGFLVPRERSRKIQFA